MKFKLAFVIFIYFVNTNYAQTPSCGSVITDTFDETSVLPSEWIEYNTLGQVTVADGKLKLDYTTDKPSVYRTFDPVSNNFTYSFDIKSTRNYVNCNMNLISSTGKYLASFTFSLQSNTNIQYASSMDNGIPNSYTGSLLPTTYNTNTVYSLSMNADFTTQNIDFYNNGELKVSDVPFLENAKDVAKIDIELIYMYNNEGRFFFDNISLISAVENRLLLINSVKTAETLLSSVSIGNKYNQYPQSAVDNFQLAVNNANVVFADCDVSSSVIDNAFSDFQTAKDIFNATQVNNPVLKIYSGYDFSGNEQEFYCGYYNGTLGEYDDWVVSFTLDKGYMVTFSENVNGTGVSKVYVAADEYLRINLPDKLQKKVSFIRVSPWNNALKKGVGAKGTDVVAALNNSWHYNWGTSGVAVGDAEFVPNQWGGGTVTKAISLGERMDISHYMAFNEPGNDDQSNMSVDIAITKYQYLLASGLRLGSPANQDNANGGNWRDEFMTKAKEQGLRVDYIVVHYYKKTSPANFYNWLKAIYDKWKRPIWVKEFNYGATWVSNKPATIEASSAGLESYINMLDEASFVERYAVFTWQPDQGVYSLMSVRNPIMLSASGIMYRDHVAPVAYTQEVYEQGDQLSVDVNSTSSEFLVFPTVICNGILNVRYSKEIEGSNVELTIYNTIGKRVKKVSDLRTEIDVSSLSIGAYFIRMKSGMKNFIKRIIIQ